MYRLKPLNCRKHQTPCLSYLLRIRKEFGIKRKQKILDIQKVYQKKKLRKKKMKQPKKLTKRQRNQVQWLREEVLACTFMVLDS